jgi:putative ABC transport system substrate-binding protein
MKLIHALLSISLLVSIAGIVYFAKYKTTCLKNADYRVAIFVPAVHPAMDEIVRGFKETITDASKKCYAFDEYNANGNSTLLRAQADEIIQHNYDLVFTIGAKCAQTIFELSRKRQSLVPQIFSAIDDPLSMGLIASLQAPGGQVTGITATTLYEQQINALLHVKPAVKNVLLVYDPAHGTGLEKNREEFEHILHAKNITLHAIEVAHPNEIAQKVPSFLNGIDVVLMLTDHTVCSGIDSLITLCGRHGITLYASDLNSGDKGAALAFGVREYDYGMLGAQLAKRILEEKESPASIPVSGPQKQYLKINTKTMDKQGLHLTKAELDQCAQEGDIII